ncbi:glycosyltransferase [Leucobacter sp. M11]|uniref:glycosyltransferase n=1 Tax=Leucobacter sp. M11 TaxID=2993565 RepID=UPI002D7E1B79|nr:glycosyltransferase [Leucobacter sp. M11]MEB4615404.1 glycosyltransferase [Leucobacter sp. M11]
MPKKFQKIVFVQNQLADLGGVSKFTSVLGLGLQSRGYEVEFGAINDSLDGERMPYPASVPEWTLVGSRKPPYRKDFTKFFGTRFQNYRFEKALERFRVSVADAASQQFSQYGKETLVIFTQVYARERIGNVVDFENRRGRFSVVSQYHNSFQAAKRGPDLRRVLSAYPNDDQFVCLTAHDAAEFRKAGFNHSTFVLNPIESPSTAPAPLDARIAVSLGRYNHQKSLGDMISAWSMIPESVNGWQLHLYGEGPEREQLESKIKSLNLENSVILMGQTDDPKTALKSASVHVQSSRYEGLPLALMEASIHGVPSVAYDCAPGIGEIITPDVTGILVPPGDQGALAQGIRTLVEDADLRKEYGAAGLQHIKNKFDLEMILDEWEDLFAHLAR